MSLDDEMKKIKLDIKALDFCKRLNEYSNDEKIKHFDELHKFAYSIIQTKIDGKWHEDNDDSQYAYEKVMFILARNPESFWTNYNEFFK